MKIMFVLQRRFAYVGHAIAVGLKNNFNIKDFCAYVELEESLNFLKSQTEIQYSNFITYEDLHHSYKNESLDIEYIKKLEKDIGLPNLWPYIEIDRIIRYGQHAREYPHEETPYTHEEMLRIIQAEAKLIDNFLDREKPDALITSVVIDTSTMLLWHIAKSRGIKTFFIQTARTEGRYGLTEEYGTLSFVVELFKKLREKSVDLPEEKKVATKFLGNFRARPSPAAWIDTPNARPIDRKRQFKFLRPDKFPKTVYWFFKTSFEFFFGHRGISDELIKKPWFWLWDRLVRKIRVLRGFEDLYDKIDALEDYAFYPLQMEPEMSLSLFSPFYKDQLWLAKQIANSLPVYYKLYIKEHPAMVGFRPRKYYEELKKIPNVKLIHPALVSFNLTINAKIVLTPAGTAAWEAALFKIPAVTFGNAFFNVLSSIKQCRAIGDLSQIISGQLYNFHYSEEEIVDLLTAIFKGTVELDLVKIWNVDGGSFMDEKKEVLLPFVNLLAKTLGLTKNNSK